MAPGMHREKYGEKKEEAAADTGKKDAKKNK